MSEKARWRGMPAWIGIFSLAGLSFFLSAIPLPGQTLDIGAGGGYGAALGEDRGSTGAGAGGFYVGFSEGSMHKVQFDFLFAEPRNRNFDMRFITGSYVIQSPSGDVRPFFQVGAGAEIRKIDVPPPPPIRRTSTDLAVIFGGGATLNVAEPLFIRPELRSYVTTGSNVLVMPMVTMGWRF